ncbi:hypothetical protein GCM10018793_49830 [Streptomyces sulfonofaciens]|uniref:Uncharacterized protein n=1 Tax=Streptomyces sulfonofaciens TaxID=68272 RepID=A0A919GIN6_9ACTN|nr:hypothetical protein [Streptomyces sulfonofaciens]GHH84691.1 hypothetical protein GCM10018793_49830 [Streptomyces sulfonofaciens]
MKQAGAIAVAVILLVWLVWNLWNLLRIAGGLRTGSWRRPMWWARVCSVSLLAGLASWLRGAFSGGLDIREACQFVHHEHYDAAYWQAHAREFRKLFPLHSKCNAHVDLVPAWVNPAVVSCAAVSLAAAAVLLWFAVAPLTRVPRGRNGA